MKVQSAIEFMSTYAFMLLILALIILAIFYFATPVQSTIPSQCNILGGMSCSFAVYHPNSGAQAGTANMIFYLSNTGSAPIQVIGANVVINNKTFTGQCSTAFMDPGSSVICWAKVFPSTTIGSQVKGYISISANYCNSGISQFGNAIQQSQCSYTPVVYTGSFFTYSSFITANTIATTSIFVKFSPGTLSPQTLVLDSGQIGTLTVSSTSGGLAPYTYTWFTQGGCAGLGTVILTGNPNAISVSSSGTYSVMVSDSMGASYCLGPAQVTVNPALLVSILPASQSYWDNGNPVTFTSTVTGGTTPYSYQWNSGSPCTTSTGTTTTSYTITPPYPSASYCLQVTDSATTPATMTSSSSTIASAPQTCYGVNKNALGLFSISASPASCTTTPPSVLCGAADDSGFMDSFTGGFGIAYERQHSGEYYSAVSKGSSTTCSASIPTSQGEPFAVDAFGIQNPPISSPTLQVSDSSFSNGLDDYILSGSGQWFVVINLACGNKSCSNVISSGLPSGCSLIVNYAPDASSNLYVATCIQSAGTYIINGLNNPSQVKGALAIYSYKLV